jgi:hypothetical protein
MSNICIRINKLIEWNNEKNGYTHNCYQITVKLNKKLDHGCIIACDVVMLALRTEVAIRMRRTIAIDVRMATTMIKVIRIVTTLR